MSAKPIVEERITLTGRGPSLAGILAYPAAGRPSRAVLVCSPHPHFAGNMENNVVRALARDLASDSATLRFDYRGVGDSAIELPEGRSVFDYWNEIEESQDYRDARHDVETALHSLQDAAAGLPLAVAGYSFGAVVGLQHACANDHIAAMVGISPPLTRVSFDFLASGAKPCLLLSARSDFVYSEDKMREVLAASGNRIRAELMDGDHFFRGEEKTVCDRAGRFLRAALPVGEGGTSE